MKEVNKLYLDTSRHFLRSIQNGSLKNINVKQMLQVMTEEFNPGYGNVDESDFNSVAKLVTETYRHYDDRLKSSILKK